MLSFPHSRTRKQRIGALVTGDKKKSDELARRYRLDPSSRYSYEDYDKCLKSGKVDAVYIGLPNHMHCDYTVRAAKAGYMSSAKNRWLRMSENANA